MSVMVRGYDKGTRGLSPGSSGRRPRTLQKHIGNPVGNGTRTCALVLNAYFVCSGTPVEARLRTYVHVWLVLGFVDRRRVLNGSGF